jgi:type IV pilus assembly protein PilY1
MNAPFRKPCKLAGIAVSVAGALGFGAPVESGTLSIATEPLGTAITAVKPNVMFILDDSGSMAREYMPDYVEDSQSGGNTASCFDAGDDSSGTIDGTPDACRLGDPPFMSPDLNTIYYNPAIFYRPALNYDGTQKPSQNSTNTSNWASVRTDHYNVENYDQRGNGTSFVNLTTSYPDRVWCTDPGDSSADTTLCQKNSAYLYPNHEFPYGQNSSNATKYRNGAPYYYRIQTTQYCKPDGTECKHGSQINPAVHTLEQVEFCRDTELTDCQVGSAATAGVYIHSGVRWCNNANLLEDPVTNNPRTNYCQRKKIGNFIYAKHLGKTVTSSVTSAPAVAPVGTIVVSSVVSGGGTITSITIGATTVVTNLSIPGGSSTSAAASLIAAQIDADAAYDAVSSGSRVLITQATAGAAGNGDDIVVISTGTPSSAAFGTLALTTGTSSSNNISSIRVGATELLCTNTGANLFFGSSVNVPPGTNRIIASSGWNNANEVSAVMQAIASRIDACTGTSGYSATLVPPNKVIIHAPLSLGASINGESISWSTSTTNHGFSDNPMQGGAQADDIDTEAGAMAGGANAITSNVIVRIGVGKFTRTNIVSTTPTYAKAAGRTDCLGASSCTYAEEMTNFANWYTYYRSRMKMMKSAAGRAFVSVPETYRVGFITINPMSSGSVSNSRYLRVSEFTAAAGGHKESFYSKFYAQDASGGTPLREALSRVGWMYAGKLNEGLTSGITDEPMTVSCQPNFAILSTDGYWNGAGGKDLDNNDMANQDNVDAGYSTRAVGAFDGKVLETTAASASQSGGMDTLADVAMYYYKTDLRTSGTYATNNVPTTNKDTNSTQHMVTFTLGLGLDGELSYRPDYETALSGDFADIKSNLRNWPAPRGDTPKALDDLWHAAVNGRGVFFSAKDPETLANALTDTLDQLTTRVGAGAAAATSNLQPVAGDNFAFTAQYQTSSWVGDLKARTIDLSTGRVSQVTLWSAAALLDLMDHTDRNIFTYDAGDSAGNLMKHLCWPATGGTVCSDGSGLTASEQAYFDPINLSHYNSDIQPNAGKLAQASAQKLLNFVRGERDYEDSTLGIDTDLFRARLNLLGDIINAQPAYVKKSPFRYRDAGYENFQKCTVGGAPASSAGCPAALFPDLSKARLGTVFAAANDGMLHAFETDVNNNPYYQTAGIGSDITTDDTFSCDPATCNVGNGVERWAYVPGLVLPRVRNLADNPYTHRYYTDGSPTVGDVCISSTCASATAADWRTILVGGLNAGGIGYYALDITNPAAPKALWEFTHRDKCWTDAEIDAGDKTDDCHLGLSYGNPLITKLENGKWVVIVSSGYNNTVGTSPNQGDGRGYLYILEAHTGKILERISTGVGSVASPSGFAKINGFAEIAVEDNTVLAVYGGDLEGNMWRFSSLDTASPVVVKIAVAKASAAAGGATQPITVKPELGKVDANPAIRVVLFGTGKFLENGDKTSTGQQTIYGLRDDPATTTGPIIPDVRAGSAVSARTFNTPASNTRTIDDVEPAPSWTGASYGWLVDLPETGERVNVDPQLQLGTFIVSSNVPSGDTCAAGGSAWLNFIDFVTGNDVGGGATPSQHLPSSLAVGINVIMLPGGKVVTIVTTADNQQLTKDNPPSAGAFGGRRVSWRELVRD